jgi:hypothetical protein
MEPSGRNRWQPEANGMAPKRLRQAKTVAVGCDQFHGKKGVSGSSPEEGFAMKLLGSPPNAPLSGILRV